MGFRLRHGLNALVALGVLVACNTYTSDLLVDGDPESTNDSSETSDSTLTTASGGSTSQVTTTIHTVTSTSTSTSTNGGDGGSGGSTTSSPNDTTDGGGSGGDSTATSTSTDTDTETTITSTSAGAGSGGDGGSTNTGGRGGSATGGTGGSSTTGIDVLLIDDLEDGNNQIETPTYSGYWFTTANEDGDGTLAPAPTDDCDPEELDMPRDGSEQAMHVSGSWSGTDLEWIAAFGFPLKHDEAPVDASSYAGITFFAKTDNEETDVRLQVMIEEVEDEGHFAIELGVTSSWEQYTVLWDDERLIQPSWAAEVTFDPAALFKLQFQFDSESFDLWVDDIRFVAP